LDYTKQTERHLQVMAGHYPVSGYDLHAVKNVFLSCNAMLLLLLLLLLMMMILANIDCHHGHY